MWSVVKTKIVGRGMCRAAMMVGAFFALESAALAQSPSHAYINEMRSSYNTHYFVSIGATGMSGTLTNVKLLDDGTKEADVQQWQGYGIRNEVGVEFLKFLQFSVAHTSMNLRSKADSTQNLAGSRLEATGSLNFYAPLGNLQMGGGFLGSRVDVREQSSSSDYYGSGYFYNVGYNYFLTSMISFYADARRSNEHLSRNSGQELPNAIESQLTEVGLGFKIWM